MVLPAVSPSYLSQSDEYQNYSKALVTSLIHPCDPWRFLLLPFSIPSTFPEFHSEILCKRTAKSWYLRLNFALG